MNLFCMFNELEHCFTLCWLIDVNMLICGGGGGGGWWGGHKNLTYRTTNNSSDFTVIHSTVVCHVKSSGLIV